MVLIDTSVIIDSLNGKETDKTLIFDRLLDVGAPFGISIFTLHEILQGAANEKEFAALEAYLSTQKIFVLPNVPEVFAESAKLFYNLRRQGVTIRNTIDILIAFTAIYFNIPLLHNDRDFTHIAEKTPNLKILHWE